MQRTPGLESPPRRAFGFNRFKLHGDRLLLLEKRPRAALALAGRRRTAAGAGLPALSPAGTHDHGAKPKQSPILRRAATTSSGATYCAHGGPTTPSSTPRWQLCTTTRRASRSELPRRQCGPALAYRADGTPVEIGITSLGPGDCDTTLPTSSPRRPRLDWVGEWMRRQRLARPRRA